MGYPFHLGDTLWSVQLSCSQTWTGPFKMKGVLHMSCFMVVKLICNKFDMTKNVITVNECVYRKFS